MMQKAAGFRQHLDYVVMPGDIQAVKAAVQASNPDVPVYIYEDAGHGFNNEDPDRHAAGSADLARQRTLELFDRA